MLVIDLKASERRSVRPYNYADYKGSNIQLSQDVESASWASVGFGNQPGNHFAKGVKSCTVPDKQSGDGSLLDFNVDTSRTLPEPVEKHSAIVEFPILESVSGNYAIQIEGGSAGGVTGSCIAETDLFVVNR